MKFSIVCITILAVCVFLILCTLIIYISIPVYVLHRRNNEYIFFTVLCDRRMADNMLDEWVVLRCVLIRVGWLYSSTLGVSLRSN